MDVRGRNGQSGQHRLIGHAVITVLVIRRNMPFVAPKELCLGPWHRGPEGGIAGQELVQALRRGSSGKRHSKRAFRAYRLFRKTDKHPGRGAAQYIGIRNDLDLTRV